MPESFTPHLRTGLSLLLGRVSRSHCICGELPWHHSCSVMFSYWVGEDVTKGGM